MRNVDIEDFGGFERYGRGKPFDKLRRKPSVGSKVAQSYSPQTIEERYPESSAESERLDSPDVVHVGDVLFIADKVWRIDNPKSEDHPGVCGFAPVELGVPFLQGTDERNLKRWYRARYHLFRFLSSVPWRNGTPSSTGAKPQTPGWSSLFGLSIRQTLSAMKRTSPT